MERKILIMKENTNLSLVSPSEEAIVQCSVLDGTPVYTTAAVMSKELAERTDLTAEEKTLIFEVFERGMSASDLISCLLEECSNICRACNLEPLDVFYVCRIVQRMFRVNPVPCDASRPSSKWYISFVKNTAETLLGEKNEHRTVSEIINIFEAEKDSLYISTSFTYIDIQHLISILTVELNAQSGAFPFKTTAAACNHGQEELNLIFKEYDVPLPVLATMVKQCGEDDFVSQVNYLKHLIITDKLKKREE